MIRALMRGYYMKKLTALFLLIGMVFVLAACGGKSPSGGSGSSRQSGVVVPDKFSFEGGTGRVSISCSEIIYDEGKPYATIVFGSESYTYIKIDGEKYDCEHKDGTSFASIPITVNANNTIYAETTRMSEAHEIEYEIFVYVSDGNSDPYALLRGTELDEGAPYIPGIASPSKTALESTDTYRLFEYQSGIYLLEMKNNTGSSNSEAAADPEGYLTKAMTTEAAQENLYKNSVIKYLMAPADVVLPAGIEKEAIVIRIPASNVYFGLGDIELKEIVEKGYDLLAVDPAILADGTEAFDELASNAANLGIPLIVNPHNDTISQLLVGDDFLKYFAEK